MRVKDYYCEQCRVLLHPQQVRAGVLHRTKDGDRYFDPLPMHRVRVALLRQPVWHPGEPVDENAKPEASDFPVRDEWHPVNPNWS